MGKATLDHAARNVHTAWTDHGKAPSYHKTMRAKLHREWPTLATALDQLTEACVHVDKPKDKDVQWEQLPLPEELRWKL
jgi:hypothetical protein